MHTNIQTCPRGPAQQCAYSEILAGMPGSRQNLLSVGQGHSFAPLAGKRVTVSSRQGESMAWGEPLTPLLGGLRSGPEGSSTGISLDHPEAAIHLLRVTQPGAFDLGFQCVAQVSLHQALDEWGSQWVIPSSITFPTEVQLQEPMPYQPAQTTARLRYGGAGSICWCTSGTQMHSFKEKQTQTEMTDCQLPGAYHTSHIPTEQRVFVAACHLLESIHLAVRQPRCPRRYTALLPSD